jgi:hypothetical protein
MGSGNTSARTLDYQIEVLREPVPKRSNPMTMTSGTPRSRRRGLYGLLAGGLLSASAATLIALPVANAQCDQTVGNSIDSYLKQHPDLHQQLQNQSRAEGGNGNVMDYLNRHPDVRQHLIDLSQQCAP